MKMGKFRFIKGFFKNLFNPRISIFSFISSNVKIDGSAYIYRGVKMKRSSVGAHTYISAYTDVENAEIGRFCSIADHCRIGMGGHSMELISTSPIFTELNNGLREPWVTKNVFTRNSDDERVFIGNDVWVGSHVLIKAGVRINDGACIAAGAVVVKDVPPYAVVGGVPARIIKFRFDEKTINELLRIKWWYKDDEFLKKNIDLFQRGDIDCEFLKERFC